MLPLPDGEGILPAQWLRKAYEFGIVHSKYTIPDTHFQPASLDLRLGEKAHRLRCSFLPDQQTVEAKLERYSMGELDLRDDGAILEQNRPYLIPLMEELKLPVALRAKANPKSSTGRLDIFTRIITDRSYRFDEIEQGYSGRLYLEVVSRSFTIKVRSGLALNQLRLMTGAASYTDEELLAQHTEAPLIFVGERPVPIDNEVAVGRGLFLSLDLFGQETSGIVGYRAKRNSHLLDLALTDHYDPVDFWEPVRPERNGRLVLEPEEFYLLLSLQGVRVPPSMAAEMTAYDPTSGELRTHYAGFFDPGFGHGLSDRSFGSRAALEVRAHDVPFMVEHGQKVCKLRYERMLEPSDTAYGQMNSHYQFQVETLSKHFRRNVPPPMQLRFDQI